MPKKALPVRPAPKSPTVEVSFFQSNIHYSMKAKGPYLHVECGGVALTGEEGIPGLKADFLETARQAQLYARALRREAKKLTKKAVRDSW